MFLLIAALHLHNDGLWCQGDSPRHAANGFFWWDLLRTLPSDPTAYAVSYYARYPVIAPVAYPPLFYLLEGLFFSFGGPIPLGPKLAVLLFAIMAGLYTTAWARRWIGPAAGWAGVFLAFVPGIVLWSNAVMLNIPAAAEGLACLYHFRRWRESACRRQVLLAALYLLAVSLTYYPGMAVLFVCISWSLLGTAGQKSRKRNLAWTASAAVLAVLILGVAMHALPVLAARHIPTPSIATTLRAWTFYLVALPIVLGPVLLVLGLAGLGAALLSTRWRPDAGYLFIWIVGLITALSPLPAKDARYILLIAPAFVIAATAGLASIPAALPRGSEWRVALLVVGLAAGFGLAARVHVPQTSGFKEVASFLTQYAPSEPVLYDGYHDGVFGFYVRALDGRFERRVVLADKLVYQYGPTVSFKWVESSLASSTEDVVNILRKKSGCRLIAVEIGPNSQWANAQRLLRRTVVRPEFELVRSFAVSAPGTDRVDLYRITGRVEPVTTFDLSFPSYSDRVFARVAPVTR
jgi:hypothetical protein